MCNMSSILFIKNQMSLLNIHNGIYFISWKTHPPYFVIDIIPFPQTIHIKTYPFPMTKKGFSMCIKPYLLFNDLFSLFSPISSPKNKIPIHFYLFNILWDWKKFFWPTNFTRYEKALLGVTLQILSEKNLECLKQKYWNWKKKWQNLLHICYASLNYKKTCDKNIDICY